MIPSPPPACADFAPEACAQLFIMQMFPAAQCLIRPHSPPFRCPTPISPRPGLPRLDPPRLPPPPNFSHPPTKPYTHSPSESDPPVPRRPRLLDCQKDPNFPLPHPPPSPPPVRTISLPLFPFPILPPFRTTPYALALRYNAAATK